MSSSKVSPENREYYELFDRCNRSELYQIARKANLRVQPEYSKDALIRAIISEDECPEKNPSVDEWRRAIMRFLIDHRKVLETQISCPARSFEEDACFACIDMQVMHCVTSNGTENFKLIELKKNRKS